MENDVVLQINQLQKRFGTVQAVQNVNLSVRRGEIYGFLGPNGAGKTTTIGMILGLIHPTSGEIYLFGQRVQSDGTKVLRRTGALVGAPALIPYLTARENLRLMAKLYPALPRERIDEVLDLVGLHEAADRPAGKFSTGMKQRLGLGLALLNQPDLLILDEPTNGMDPAGMREVRLLLAGLAEQGMTIFLSSHLLHEVEQVCTHVAVLNKGCVVAEGPVKSLLGPGKGQPTVRLRANSPTETGRLLMHMPGTRGVQANGEYVTVSGVTGKAVIQYLVMHGETPEEVMVVRPDLESLYLELTQESSQEQG